MGLIKRVRIHSDEMGLRFREGEFDGLLEPGKYWFCDPLGKLEFALASVRDPWLVHEKLDVIVKSGELRDKAEVVDLKDHERALVWIDGRFQRVLGPGLYALWTKARQVRVEKIDARGIRFEHADLAVIMRSSSARLLLDVCSISRDHVGVLHYDGRYVESVGSGVYAFWKGVAEAKLVEVDQRETMVDVGGQEVMTADKVTLRLNAVVVYRIVDARKAVSVVDDVRQALYRETQLALRAVIGARELDAFLADKDTVAREVDELVRRRSAELGLAVMSVGVRDVILPGEMKELMNRVTEAKKAAEANLIARREETAAMRSQANTAKVLADNPTLMRLRELEVLEKIALGGKLSVVLGDKSANDKGLTDRVVELL